MTDDAEKNWLCPPNPYPTAAVDWIATNRIAMQASNRWATEEDLQAWLNDARLNAARGIEDHLADPVMQEALARFLANAESAVTNLEKLEAQLG